MRRLRPSGACFLADLAVVVAFAWIGRSSHDEAVTGSGVVHTAWPFALGTALAWVLTLLTRDDPVGTRVAVRVWLWSLVIGMVVRAALGEGTAAAFVAVAAAFLGVLMVGYRLAVRRLAGPRG